MSAQILSTSEWLPEGALAPSRRLVGMDKVALVSIALSLLIPFLLFAVERGVKLQAVPVPALPLGVCPHGGVNVQPYFHRRPAGWLMHSRRVRRNRHRVLLRSQHQ